MLKESFDIVEEVGEGIRYGRYSLMEGKRTLAERWEGCVVELREAYWVGKTGRRRVQQ